MHISGIEFFYEDTSFELNQGEQVSAWVLDTIHAEGFELSHINFVFCSDEYLHKINVEYLNHDYYTDIITFDNSEEEGMVESDIFISIDRVKDNADYQGHLFIEELHRVIIHGVLHLLAYNDKTEAEKEVMRKKENDYLSLLNL